ncbi:MAG: M3 family metallopeptidase, partial [Clostridia bacterium]|nr:M3 family metallopeptidase [Clostridia bacterium]
MAKIKALPKRSEVKKEHTWATEDIFPSDEKWFEELAACQGIPALLKAYKGRLGESSATLLEYLEQSDEIMRRISLLANYAMRKSDEDTGDSFYRDMVGKIMTLDVNIDSASAYVVPELLALGEEKLAAFMDEEPRLRTYERYISKIMRRREHTLSDAEEALLAAAGEMASSPGDIGSVFRNADLKFPNATDAEGKEYPVTQGSFIPLLESPDPVLRKSAFTALYNTFESFKNTTAAFLDAQVKSLMFFARARGYENTMAASLDRTEVPTSVYHNLIKAVNDNMHYLHRYIALRKKLMNVDELHMYDIYTPIVEGVDEAIPFESAVKTCLEGLAPLGEEYLA